MTTEQKLRDCICADPENCTQAVPGYRCRKSRSQSSRPPTSDEGTLAKNRYADTLNALVEMQESMAYAVRRSVLKSAEEAIVELERTLHAKERELAIAKSKLKHYERATPIAYRDLVSQLATIQSASAAPEEGEVFDTLKAQKDAIEERNFERDLSERLSPIAFDAMRICLGKEPKTFSAKQVVAYITEVAGATPPAATDGFVIVPRDKLEHLLEYWNGNANQLAMEDALNFILDELGALAAIDSRCAATDGFVRVPREPTEEMLRAAADCQDADPEDGYESEIYYAYKAMIDAAPQSGKKEDVLQYPEGCTPTDIAVLRKANIDLANESRRYQSALEEVQQLLSMWEGGLDEMDGEEYTKACEEWERVEKLVNDTLPPAPSSPPSKSEGEK